MDTPEGNTKLDAIVGQMFDLRLVLAQVAGDVRLVLTRVDAHGADIAEHEMRIRELEAFRTGTLEIRPIVLERLEETRRLEVRVSALERWRMWLLGFIAAGSVAGGAAGAAVAAALGLTHQQ